MNSNNPARNVGVPSHFVSSGQMATPQSVGVSKQQYLLSQPHSQTQGGPAFPGHFQLSEPQVQALAQSQFVTAHAQLQAQAAHAQFQAQLQAQAQAQGRPHAQFHTVTAINSGVSSPQLPTPAGGSGRRSNQKPPSRPPSSNTNTGSPFKTMELTPATMRKKRKLPENQIPAEVASLLPESALYTQLLEFEARMDSALTRKKLDIQESYKISPRFQKTLRIYVFNTFENQTSKTSEDKSSEPPSWSLKIIGRLLEDGKDPVIAGMTPKSVSKFSSFFKKVSIYLDKNLYPDNHVILWDNVRSSVANDGFEVKRKGDKEFSATIRLEMNYVPERFKLSQPLREVLGIESDSRIRITAAIWHYIKAKRLQLPSDPTTFMCDPPLQKVFGAERMKFTTVSLKLSQHLVSPQPIHIEHRIKLSGNSPTGSTCYDVLVDVPLSLEKEMSSLLAVTGDTNKEIHSYDELISSSIKKIHEHQKRRAFFLSFSQSPAEFINTLIASQSKDLKLVAGDASRNAEKERRSDFYSHPWVEDAVIRYLNRKSNGNDALGST